MPRTKLKLTLARGKLLILSVLILAIAAPPTETVTPTLSDIQKLRSGIPLIRQADKTATIWPLPEHYATEDTFRVLDNFKFSVVGPSCSILEAAVLRYQKVIFELDWSSLPIMNPGEPEEDNDLGMLSELFVGIDGDVTCQGTEYPDLDMDERYTIFVRQSNVSAFLLGNTIWGVIRGLETFSQLIWRLEDGRLVVNQSIVIDWPRFGHRGLMLDTSRHFISKGMLMQNLEAMAMNKMNVFHWHIVDDQSFPYQSTTFPNLSQLGAWEPKHHVYTQADIAEIIEFARLRGIRVIPEFDTPGHVQSWGRALNNLLTPCYWSDGPDGTFGPINPTTNATFHTLRRLFTEILKVFPDRYLHIGGDEVNFNCWKSNPNITRFMKKMGFGQSYEKLEEYYIQVLLDMLADISTEQDATAGTRANGKRAYIVWQEVFDNNVTLDSDTIVQIWKDRDAQNWKQMPWKQEMAAITAAGYRAVLSSCWYLNYISYGPDWKAYYRCDPQEFSGNREQMQLVIGGEACMWGEFIDDTNLLVQLWPRASAVAERLWSHPSVGLIYEAGIRLAYFRCLMNKRGIPAQPNMGPDFCQQEYGPGK